MSDASDFSDEDIPLSASKHITRASGQTPDDDDGDYKMTGALKVPRATSYTTQSLYDQIVSNDIELCPDYQRDVVWPELKQIGIIDSIFRNFYVPPLIFAVVYRPDGSERRVCIDGKQRLTSIYRFMNGEIYHKDNFTKEKFVFKDIGRFKAVKKLPERYIKIFRNKQIVCMEYQDLTNENEREIFQRVQLGMALTPAEKLQAISSPTASFIRDLQSKYVNDGLAVELDWDASRGGDFRCLVHAIYNMEKWPALNTVPGMAAFQKMLQRDEEPEEEFCKKVHQTFRIFLHLARDEKYNSSFHLPDVKKVAPVEFIAIATLIHVHKYKLTYSQLTEAITTLRKHVREREVDIRMNGRVMKIMIDFIKDLKPSQLKPDPNSLAAAKLQPLKRKRGEAEDGEDDDGANGGSPKKRAPRAAPVSLTASQAHAMSTASPAQRSTSPVSAPRLTPVSESVSSNDRLAALKAAKANGATDLSIPRSLPSEPAALRHLTSTHSPYISPPPSEPSALRNSTYSYSSSLHPAAHTLPRRTSTLEDDMMARMGQHLPKSQNGPPYTDRAPLSSFPARPFSELPAMDRYDYDTWHRHPTSMRQDDYLPTDGYSQSHDKRHAHPGHPLPPPPYSHYPDPAEPR